MVIKHHINDGNSWCPDCVKAHPFIEKGIQSAPGTYHYIIVSVGDRAFWKNSKCPFRTNSEIHIQTLPTLVKWGTQKRLEGDQLLNNDLIEMLLAEDDN
ncbi:PREDICTED: thioredoxin domain-containing protein 17-like isoform X2 [Ceratosolen solmsi marchali]|uniref:Thioredoxin domain-containing protein 17 n=1 Tax=Ceratosolen solmsi marchali TaxID=326594 RepID=A0AAJ7E3K3_9HYME|nr:PREDICTED: thioredoxin domain-containing protein 17-like isoform X2 [Ceratosolen solmsi marchali]XP_011506561.1 PREDICTED: thioredoxin domain-containing protein 17-like isoform X2 [Ceratosolen solmsi marchali]